MWYFYVLQSQIEPDYFYKGSTGDLRKRLKQHNEGEVNSTKPRRPWKLVYYEAYISEKAARIRESAVKKSGSVSVPLLDRIKASIEQVNKERVLSPSINSGKLDPPRVATHNVAT